MANRVFQDLKGTLNHCSNWAHSTCSHLEETVKVKVQWLFGALFYQLFKNFHFSFLFLEVTLKYDFSFVYLYFMYVYFQRFYLQNHRFHLKRINYNHYTYSDEGLKEIIHPTFAHHSLIVTNPLYMMFFLQWNMTEDILKHVIWTTTIFKIDSVEFPEKKEKHISLEWREGE